jgi:hypothetical protein
MRPSTRNELIGLDSDDQLAQNRSNRNAGMTPYRTESRFR